jgi:hypothetical protein
MQDLSDAAENVLGPKYPDSGTAGRIMAGGLAAGGGYMLDPTIPMALGAASVPYLPGANKVMAAVLAGERPKSIQAMQPLVRALAAPAAVNAIGVNRQ